MRRAVFVVMAVALGACGGDVEQEDFDQRLSQVLCEHADRCGLLHDSDCDEDPGPFGHGIQQRYQEALASGRLRFDSEAAERCLDFLQKADCTSFALTPVMQTRGLEYDDACAFLKGQVAQGQPCTWSVECGAGAYCAPSEGEQCLRVCTPRPAAGTLTLDADACAPGELIVGDHCQRPLERGAGCAFSDIGMMGPCARGLRCAPESHTCQPQPTEGAPCGGDRDDWCGWARVCIDGTCRPLREKGEACNGSSSALKYGFGDCQQGLYCDADRGQRGVCRELRPVGQSCRDGSECGADTWCVGGGEGERGTCQRLPGRGEPCGPERLCAGALSCHPDSNTCLPSAGPGEKCDAGVTCLSPSVCTEGRCQLPGTCH